MNVYVDIVEVVNQGFLDNLKGSIEEEVMRLSHTRLVEQILDAEVLVMNIWKSVIERQDELGVVVVFLDTCISRNCVSVIAPPTFSPNREMLAGLLALKERLTLL